MRQIAINLINNAIKFTPKGGTVSLAFDRLENGELAISVTDTGRGIAPEAVGRLFQPFAQVDSAGDRRQGGSGLGLSIVNRWRAARGSGARSIERKARPYQRLPAWRLSGAHESPRRDDNVVNRRILRMLLGALGHTVISRRWSLAFGDATQVTISLVI